jgi:hypothetical protein
MAKSWLLWLMVVSSSAFGGELTFGQAKSLADHDEGALSQQQQLVLNQTQAPVVQSGLAGCLGANGEKPFSFVVVVELDSTGKVRKTWRSDDAGTTECFQNVVAKATLFSPPKSPFYSSFEMKLSADDIHRVTQ